MKAYSMIFVKITDFYYKTGLTLLKVGGRLILPLCLVGIVLILKKKIHWQIPVSMLVTFVTLATITAMSGHHHLSMISQLFSGAMMFGAFFIATDPVTASITPRGSLYLVHWLDYWFTLFVTLETTLTAWHLRFLLSNICVPLIDYYTRPRVAGHFAKGRK